MVRMNQVRMLPARMLQRGCLLLAAAWVALSPSLADAATTAEQRREADRLKTEIRKAGNLFVQKKFTDSGAIVKSIQEELAKMASGAEPDVLLLLATVHSQLERAHALLELEGVELPPLKPLAEMAGGGDKPGPGPATGVSFKDAVAPVLVAKCGRCHVENARGMFSMASYDALMKGPAAGVVIFPGDPVGSRLIEVIESGDMPRGGLKVTAEEKAVLVSWIKAGAKFDGPDRTQRLTALAPDASTDLPTVEIQMATGKETISFSRDIAPVLSEKCADCHGNGQRPSGRFNLTNFTAMIRGGENGPPVLPGKPAESLLLKKLKGTAEGERMPRGMPPLPDETIAKFEKWIQEGATFDGPDRDQHVRDVAELYKAKMSTHEELSAARDARATEAWNLGMPGIAADRVQTEHYLIVGNVGENTLANFGKAAETVAPKVASLFQAPSDQPLVKGRLTLFVFEQRYDYSEFGKMVERRDLPKAWRGHWRFNVVDAYAAMITPRRDEYSTEALVAQQLAAVYVASLGNSPEWFAEGSARVAASRLAADDPRVRAWDDELSRVLGAMKSADDFLTGKLPPEDRDIASYSFVKYLMKDSKKYQALLGKIQQSENFDQAFSAIFGGSPGQAAEYWARTAIRRKR